MTDPRNLGAVVRSAAAFGAQGVLVPERRVGPDDGDGLADRAGAAARLPVARVTNLVRAIKAPKQAGLFASGWTPTARSRWTTWMPRSTRSCWSSVPRAAGCPGWSARPAT